MASHAIIDKLRNELIQEINSERQVVYLLVEIRKLMEIHANGASFRALKFACDWIAHARLEGTEARKIVQQIDKAQQIIEAGYDIATSTRVQRDCLMAAMESLSLSKFRTELEDYLVQYSLDYGIAADNTRWASFLTFYAAVVEDCPLMCVAKNITPMYADEVVLNVLEVVADPAEQKAKGYQVLIEWSWKSKVSGTTTVNRQTY